MNEYIYPKSFGSNPLFPLKKDFVINKTSRRKGLGVLTTRSFKAGEFIAKIDGPRTKEILQHTLQISKDEHLHDTYFSGYFLHSCDPNVKVDMQKLEVWALKSIKKNTYLYMDYSDTEDHLFKSFQCNCGSPKCRKIIRGKKDKELLSDHQIGDPQSLLYKEKRWWERGDLQYKDDQLYFADRLVKNLSRRANIPTFFYSAARVRENLDRLLAAFEKRGMKKRVKVFYAMKANRFTPLITLLKSDGKCGIDACSPQEVEHAINCGFSEEDISFTATSISKSDFAILARYPNIHVNCDSITTLKQCIKHGIKKSLGVRINPEVGVSRSNNDNLQYTGTRLSKFGIYKNQLESFIKTAKHYNVEINTIHFHTGCGYLNENLKNLEKVFQAAQGFIEKFAELKNINIGGGLGVPHSKDDTPLDLDKWTFLIKKYFGKGNFNIQVEPGEYIMKDAGILLLEKTYQEKKKDKMFVGLNAGFNVAMEPAFYKLPFEPVILERYHGKFINYNIVGNINEALDIWFEDYFVEDLNLHTHLALINAGAYSSSMSSNHCMRGEFRETLLV